MALRRAFASRVDGAPRPRGRPRVGTFGTMLLALIPVGLAVGQAPWPQGGRESGPTSPSFDRRDRGDDGALANDLDGSKRPADVGGGGSGASALDLAARGARLEVRAALIAQSLTEGNGDPAVRTCRPPAVSVGVRTVDVSPVGLRLSRDEVSPAAGSADSPLPDPDTVAARVGALEARQAAIVSCLNGAIGARVTRVRDALAATGLSSRSWGVKVDIGGPFVPLPAAIAGLEDAVMILRGARREAARLDDVAARVPLRRPLRGQVEVTSAFGVRLDPFYGRPALHTGLDLTGAYGAAVAATASGTVTMAGSDGGYGNMVEIDHGAGLVTRYAHLSEVVVTVGQRLDVGTIIGRVGASGRATGPHLHYETRIDGEPVDPARFLEAGAMIAPSEDRS